MTGKISTERDSSFELLRLILMFLIVFHHAITHGLGLDSFASWSNTPLLIQEGEMSMYLALNNLGIFAVNAFVIISGLFGIKARWKKVCALLGMVAFYTICFTTIPGIIAGDVTAAVKSLLFISHTPYWFITDYLLLMLFSPALNKAFETVEEKTMKTFTVILVAVAVYLGFLWGNDIDRSGYNFFHFIVLYSIGRSISKGWVKSSKTVSCVLLITAILINTIIAIAAYRNGHNDLVWKTTYYSNPLVILSAVALVLYVSEIHFKNKTVNRIAASSVAIYLFQNTDFISRIFYGKVKETGSMGGGVNPLCSYC